MTKKISKVGSIPKRHYESRTDFAELLANRGAKAKGDSPALSEMKKLATTNRKCISYCNTPFGAMAHMDCASCPLPASKIREATRRSVPRERLFESELRSFGSRAIPR
jgi:hypothetical protein